MSTQHERDLIPWEVDPTSDSETKRGVSNRSELKKLARELIRIRLRRNMTQREVGERCGISQASVSEFESLISDPRLETIARYAFAVGAKIETTIIPASVCKVENSLKH